MKTKNATAKICRQRRATIDELTTTARRFDAIAEKHGLNRRDAINDAINEWVDRYLVMLEINQLAAANETAKT